MVVTTRIMAESLQSEINVKIITPTCGIVKRILILLHGKKEREEENSMIDRMTEVLNLEALSNQYQLMIVLPSMKNCYYISTKEYDCNRFISDELIRYINKMYDISDSVEKILGGISMGGYGAALIGANTDVFKKIVSISGSYIVEDIMIGNPEVWGSRTPSIENTKGTFLSYFLPLSGLAEDESKNVDYALSLLKKKEDVPLFLLTCGTEDWLYSRNIAFTDRLREQGIEYEFFSLDGGKHDNACFHKGIWMALEKILK